MDNKEKNITRCSFCGKTADMVEKMISGPDANICNECVLLCNEIVFEDMERYDDHEICVFLCI